MSYAGVAGNPLLSYYLYGSLGTNWNRFNPVSRYPDALPGVIPGEAFAGDEIEEAIQMAETRFSRVNGMLEVA